MTKKERELMLRVRAHVSGIRDACAAVAGRVPDAEAALEAATRAFVDLRNECLRNGSFSTFKDMARRV